MANVLISGLPDNSKVQSLIYIFKAILKQAKVRKFWIKDLSDIRGTGLMAATIEMYDHKDAVKALDLFDGYAFKVGVHAFPLRAEILDPPQWLARPSPPRDRDRQEYRPREERPRRQRYERFPRERSRSPVFRDEASKLDMEIELLRKQRMIIEEERRLILERKKLELMQEFGPSAVKDFDRFEDREYGRPRRFEREGRPRSPPPRRPVRERVGPIPAPQHLQPTTPAKRARTRPHLGKDRLPNFYAPCNLIINEMRELIAANTTETQLKHLHQILRTTLRKRFAICLGDESRRLTAKAIADLYRVKHPAAADESLVNKLLNDIAVSNLVKCDDGPVSGEKVIKDQGKGTTNESTNAAKKTAVIGENATNDVNEQVDSVTDAPNTDSVVKDANEENDIEEKEETAEDDDITEKTVPGDGDVDGDGDGDGDVAENAPDIDSSLIENAESESVTIISDEDEEKLNQEKDTPTEDVTVVESKSPVQLSAEVALNLGEDSADWTEVDDWTSTE